MTSAADPAVEPLATAPAFGAYAYAYPHKTAYRRLEPPVPLADVWRDEPVDSLALYVHVPFCEWRCGFCNLFTQARPRPEVVLAYVDALARQAAVVRRALPPRARFTRLAIGGGTPTYLDAGGLARLFDLTDAFGAGGLPTSVEVSPESTTPEKVALLRARGATRVSIGVQTFDEAEARAVSRPQRTKDVEAALDRLRGAGFPVLNLDLIYGLPGQTPASFVASLERALAWRPEEVYLYPLYVRPLTGLELGRRAWDDERLQLLRLGRELLRARGYAATSMRMFRAPHAPTDEGPAYCCQSDGMVGLGAGARSYTRALHWSTGWAVSQGEVKAIIDEFVARDDAAHGVASYGFRLDEDEQRRRWALQTLLQADGLDLAGWRARFGGEPLAQLPQLRELLDLGWAAEPPGDGRLVLTEAGLERSDAIGPWLTSPRVRALMGGFEVA